MQGVFTGICIKPYNIFFISPQINVHYTKLRNMKQTSANIEPNTLVEVKEIAAKSKWSVAYTIGFLVEQAIKERNRKKKKND